MPQITRHPGRKLATIYAGGVVGALLRVGLARAFPPAAGTLLLGFCAFPLGIFAVNVLGALAIGVVAGSTLDGEAATIATGGVIGSFTTFSTWILDSQRLAIAGLAELAWLNIGLSSLAGFAAVVLGHLLGGLL